MGEAAEEAIRIGDEGLLNILEEYREWQRVGIFGHDEKVVAATYRAKEGEIEALLGLFESREKAITHGIDIDGVHFDVHRWYDGQIYGRQEGNLDGPGFVVLRTKKGDDGPWFASVITYELPMVSARAVPMLQKFCAEHVAKL